MKPLTQKQLELEQELNAYIVSHEALYVHTPAKLLKTIKDYRKKINEAAMENKQNAN